MSMGTKLNRKRQWVSTPRPRSVKILPSGDEHRSTAVKIDIEHIAGVRRGQIQTFDLGGSGGLRSIRLGRGSDNEVVFDATQDTAASTRHAELVPDGEGLLLRDLGSSNGTRVSDRRITEHRLASGEVVEFGQGGPRLRF